MSIWLLPVLFSLVAVITRKDLAFYSALVSILGAAAYSQDDWVVEHTLVVFAGLNTSLCLFGSYHYAAYRHKLAAVVAILSCIATLNNLAQVIQFTLVSVYISEALGWLLLASLVCLPGRKGWIRDAAMDIEHHINNRIRDVFHGIDGGSDR